MSSMVQRTGRN